MICCFVPFGDHVPYLRVLAPRKDVQGTIYLWAKGASLNCWEFEQYCMFLIIWGACSVFNNDTFGLKRDIG
jgi:hypothetical protein